MHLLFFLLLHFIALSLSRLCSAVVVKKDFLYVFTAVSCWANITDSGSALQLF